MVETAPESGSREAKYRTQLRAAEGERDALRARLDTRDRADVERDVQGKLIDPKDLWAAGVKLDDVRNDDCEIDPELVDQACARCVGQQPRWGVPTVSPAAPATAVTFGAEKPNQEAEQPTWQGVFQSAMRKP
ncbi:MAG TPA: hypothetical protein VE197_19215 [Mycobacterium sp.]|nr:hypothetical protein [Mycobacterium sp.]